MSGPANDKPDDEARQAVLGLAAPGSMPGSEIEPRTFGRYEVVASIGRGGMGEVYLARVRGGSPGSGRLVALKVLLEEAGQDDELLAMFMDEASIMAQIHHPNVLEVFDFGKERGLYYLAMEYLQGRPLVRVMIDGYQREQGLDYGLIALIGADAARGLHAAHVATSRTGAPLNVVHRDVSPQNIFVLYSGPAKVIDFGVARAAERFSRTAVGQLKGKAAYMSPEQVNGGLVDGRSDVFALGACLWEMAAGRRLFRRGNDWETMSAVLEGPILAPSRVRGLVDPTLDAIILSALARDPERRTGSAGELEAELTEYARRLGALKQQPVAPFMERLFGAEAESERALIRKLEERVATDLEQDNLRRLSGISPLKDPDRLERGITLAGRPEELAALDAFGPKDPIDAMEITGQTDPTIAMPPDVLTALRKRLMSASHAGGGGGDTDPNATPPPLQLTRVVRDEQSEPLLGLTPPPTRVPALAEPTVLDKPLASNPANERAEAVHRAVEALQAEQLKNRRSAQRGPTRADRPSRLDHPAPTDTGWKGWLIAVAGAGILVGLMFALRSSFAPLEPPAPAPGLLGTSAEPALNANGSTGLGGTSGATGATSKPGTSSAGIMRFDTVVVDPGDEAPSPQLLSILGSNGLAVIQSGARLLVDDGSGAIAVSNDAKLVEVKAEGAAGWLVISHGPNFPQVVWVGSVRGAPWKVRALSVNDCPAQASLQPSGVEIAYGDRRILLQHGGGILDDAVIEVPPGAVRLEIPQLGLAFGAVDPARTAVFCPEGWVEGRVLLKRMPAGRYTLLWLGGSRPESTSLTVPRPASEDPRNKARLLREKRKPRVH